MNNEIYGIKQEVWQKIAEIIYSNSSVDRAFLFGSRAKGNFRDNSDIDIVIKGKNITYEEFASIKNRLDELDIPQKIDLILYENIDNKDLLSHIERVGIEI
jgi:predicted nucleotidyltransferase